MNRLIPEWPAPAHVHAFTTIRDSLSEGINRPDRDPSFQSRFSLPNAPVWLNQVHSAIAVEALPKHLDCRADASFTSLPNHICSVLTADCLPVLLCNTTGTRVAAIHAGWRGLSAGIIENTFAKLAPSSDQWLAWLGPAIGPNCFEVGEDVFRAFIAHNPEAETAFTPNQQGKWLANLYLLAKQRLQTLGISDVYGGTHCTYTEQDLFYSYRRDHGQTGRMATLIWIQAG